MAAPAYKLKHHDENAYTIQHPDGSEFQVAKDALTDSEHETIKGLPGYAEGGEVEDTPFEQLVSGGQNIPGIGVESTSEAPLAQTANAAALAQGQRPPVLPSETDQLAVEDPFKGLSAEALGRPVATPAVPTGEQVAAPSAGQPAQPEGDSAYADNFAMAQGAIDLRQKAEEGLAKGQQKALTRQVNEQEVMHAAFQQKFKEFTDQDAKLFQKASEGEIDPNHYWNSRSTGDKILATISLLLGGIGGMGHGNVGLDILNKAIDRDIEGQKANLNQKNNLFKMNMERFHNEQAAFMATQAQLTSLTAAKMNLAAAQAASPEAKARALAAGAQLGQQAIALRTQLAQQQARNSVLGASGEITPFLNSLPPEEAKGYRERIVKMPTGKELLAYTPKAAEEVRTKAGQLTNITGLIDRLDKIGPAALVPGPAQNRSQETRSALVTSLKELEKLGVLSGPDMALMDARIRNPSTFKDLLGGKAKSDSLRETINNAFENAMAANVPGYKQARKIGTPYKGKL